MPNEDLIDMSFIYSSSLINTKSITFASITSTIFMFFFTITSWICSRGVVARTEPFLDCLPLHLGWEGGISSSSFCFSHFHIRHFVLALTDSALFLTFWDDVV